MIAIVLASSISLGACAYNDRTLETAATGAAVGAVGGAAVGAVVGGVTRSKAPRLVPPSAV